MFLHDANVFVHQGRDHGSDIQGKPRLCPHSELAEPVINVIVIEKRHGDEMCKGTETRRERREEES